MAGGASTSGVRIVVAGDAKTGKSSMIAMAATENFPVNVPLVLPPTILPENLYPDQVPITIFDTSSSPENRCKLFEQLKKADAVILTYACDRSETLDSLSSHWLPELRRLELKLPVIVVGTMFDKRVDQKTFKLEKVMSPLLQQFREIEFCIECSAAKNIQIPEIFYYAQKPVLHPTAILFNQELQKLKPRCERALKRIFILCDHDKDGALNDAELNDFQVKCFDDPLEPSEIISVKRDVQEKSGEGVNDRGLTLEGFLLLHTLYIETGYLEITWTVLRKFGYNNEIRLREDQLPTPIQRYPDQSVELSIEAIDFLGNIFVAHDVDSDGTLESAELEEIFSTAPENPWSEAPYKDAAEKTALGGLSLDGFLSLWSLMTLLDPIRTVETLIYVGYGGDPSSAIQITRRRRIDRKKQQTERTVYQCFVFGPKNAGKSTLLDSFIRRPFSEEYVSADGDRYAVNVIDQPSGLQKTLVLREIPEIQVKKLLSSKDALAACDVAISVHDSSLKPSFEKSTNMLLDVSIHGESTGYEVPCLIVAAKDDLDSYLTQIQDSTRVSHDLGIDSPIHVSAKLGDLSDIFGRILRAAHQPHLSIPETVAGKRRKKYQRIINRSIVFVSVGSAVVGLAAVVCAARRNAST